MRSLRRAAACLLVASLMPAVRAQAPRVIPFQGALKDVAGVPIDGARFVVFTLYDAPTGGTPLWQESKSVTATRGVFATTLGSAAPFSAGLRFDRPYYLGIQAGTDAAHLDAEMTPRLPLGSVPYALALPNVSVDAATGFVGVNTAVPQGIFDVLAYGGASPVTQLDQQQTDVRYHLERAPGQSVGQSFIARATGNLSRLDVFCQAEGSTSWTGTATLYNGSSPTGTPIAAYNVAVPAGTEAFYPLPFSPGFAVIANHPYFLLLTVNGGTAASFVLGDNLYPDGVAYYDNYPAPSYDLGFKTYVTSPAGSVPIHALTVAPNGNVGIGASNPATPLDVRGDVSATGSLTVGGGLNGGSLNVAGSGGFGGTVTMGVPFVYAAGGAENLRIVRGTVAADGGIVAGAGFTVKKGVAGSYTLNFKPAFASPPAVTVSAITTGTGGGFVVASLGAAPTASSATASLCALSGSATDSPFTFIATGPR